MPTPLEDRIPQSLNAATVFLLKKIAYLDPDSQDAVAEAMFSAARWHHGEMRKNGHPYILHPLQAAGIVAALHSDTATVMASLLHDTLENSEVTPKELERTFGKDVRQLVEALTKYAAFSHREYAEKLYVRSQVDGRVAVLKVADCCANLMHHDQLHFSAAKHLEHLQEARELYLAWLVPLPGFPAELGRILNRIIAASQIDYETRQDKPHA